MSINCGQLDVYLKIGQIGSLKFGCYYLQREEASWNVTSHAQKPDFVFRAKRTSPFNRLALELDIYSLAHRLCKM
jgi:hypothetical protein